MNIIIDAMGGDNAPKEILLGAAAAVREYGVQITAVGRRRDIEACTRENGIDMAGITVADASETIEMCDEPTAAIRGKKDSSMVVGLRMLAAGEGDAFVSAGSTGALLAGREAPGHRHRHSGREAALSAAGLRRKCGMPARDAQRLCHDGQRVHGESDGPRKPQRGPCEQRCGGDKGHPGLC